MLKRSSREKLSRNEIFFPLFPHPEIKFSVRGKMHRTCRCIYDLLCSNK